MQVLSDSYQKEVRELKFNLFKFMILIILNKNTDLIPFVNFINQKMRAVAEQFMWLSTHQTTKQNSVRAVDEIGIGR